MVYRYRLKNIADNAGSPSRIINGIKLSKHDWIYSEERLNFKSFNSLVEEEKANNYSEFSESESQKRKPERVPVEEPEEQKPSWKQTSFNDDSLMNAFNKVTEEEFENEKDTLEEDEEKDILDMLYEELYQTAISHGFLEDEIDLFSESDDTLRYLLLLEMEVEKDEGSI